MVEKNTKKSNLQKSFKVKIPYKQIKESMEKEFGDSEDNVVLKTDTGIDSVWAHIHKE